MIDPVADLQAAAKSARTEERGWIAAHPNTAALIAFGAGFIACGVLALVL